MSLMADFATPCLLAVLNDRFVHSWHCFIKDDIKLKSTGTPVISVLSLRFVPYYITSNYLLLCFCTPTNSSLI